MGLSLIMRVLLCNLGTKCDIEINNTFQYHFTAAFIYFTPVNMIK